MTFAQSAPRITQLAITDRSSREAVPLRVRSYPPGRWSVTPDRDSVDRPLLMIWMRGGGTLRQRTRTVVAAPDSLCFLPNDAPVWMCDTGPGGAVTLELPVEVATRARDHVAAVVGSAITVDTGAAAFLRSFLDTLEHQPLTYRPDQSIWVQTFLCEITERVLAESVGSLPTPSERVVLVAKGYVATHLTDPALTPHRVAREASVSLRTLNRLFAAEGESIAGWIRRHRLEHCRDDLLDSGKAARSISQIGALWGFLDAAHFSRTFKEAFGCSPRAFRAASQSTAANDARVVNADRVA